MKILIHFYLQGNHIKESLVRLHQRYFDFKQDLKFSLSRFNAERETETERVLSLA